MSAIFDGNAAKRLTATLTGTVPRLQTDKKLVTQWVKSSTFAEEQAFFTLYSTNDQNLIGAGFDDATGTFTGVARAPFNIVIYNNNFSLGPHNTSATSGAWTLVSMYVQENAAGSRVSKIYLNGTAVSGSSTGDTNTGDMTSLIVGIDFNLTLPTNARISDFAIWIPTSEAQADSIVAALLAGGPRRANQISATATPLKYWPLNTNGTATIGGDNLSNTGTVAFDGDIPSFVYTLEAASAPYTRTGSGVGLLVSRVIQAASRSYSLSGSATLLKASTIAAASAPYIYTGSGVDLRKDSLIQAANAPYSLNGSAELTAQRLLVAASAPYSLNGSGVDLIYSPALTGYVLQAANADFNLVGSAARLAVDRYISAAQADYSLSGSAELLKGSALPAASAPYSLTGSGVDLRADRRLDVASAPYTLTGSSVDLTTTQPQAYSLEAASAEYLFTGQDVRLIWSGEPVAEITKPSGAPGKRIRFRGRYYDSIKDRRYLSRALQEFVEERIEPPKPQSRKQRKKAKAAPQFTPAEIVEVEAVINVVQEREQKLADYVADLRLMMEEEEFLMMVA